MNAPAQFDLDGTPVPFAPGQSILAAAAAAGRYLPHLCWHADFPAHGSCRLCLVDVDGHTHAACTFPAASGQCVRSRSEALDEARRALTQMLFVEGNHFCPGCEKSGDCQLQALGYFVGMLEPHYPQRFPHREVDATHPDVLLDRDRCIACALCVRASHEADGKSVFELSGRGLDTTLIVASPDGSLGGSTLAAGDRAVAVCPVGALLRRGHGFTTPIGARRYDAGMIDVVGQKT